MAKDKGDLPVEIEAEVGPLISNLRGAGWGVSASRYDAKSFGNWYVDLFREKDTVRLVKDRSQYVIGGPITEEIKAAGLWKAFNDLQEFTEKVAAWAATPSH